MKKAAISFRTLTGAMLGGLLALLGFSACKTQKTVKDDRSPVESEGEPLIRAMYGTPVSSFRVMDSVPVRKGDPGTMPAERDGSEQSEGADR
ncbi:MAG: hypothetical protein K2L46_03060 [Paramuribaculum sp.]|nr:hypothetical protein [Paramuribaculum sp.]MDE6324447.1 hypothetical protein [Paramuribaculum sp.]MDE6488236.1 hypothetical protein [Paramuribaculum sp.]